MGGQGDLHVARSRFEDSEEDEDDNADETKSPLIKESTSAICNAPTLEDIVNLKNKIKSTIFDYNLQICV